MTTAFRYRLALKVLDADESPDGKSQFSYSAPYSDSCTGGAETHAREYGVRNSSKTVWIFPMGRGMRPWCVRR